MTGYPERLTIRTITDWPGQLTERRRASPFSAGWTSTMNILNRELDAIAAVHPLLEVAIPEWMFGKQGRPYARASAEHPGVILTIPSSRVGPMRYPADAFTTWQDNLRAVVLAMEALRKIDRYGVTRRGEQYVGFAQLPAAPTGFAHHGAPVEAAAALLAEYGGGHDSSLRQYRHALKTLHPDVGGDPARFRELQEAWEMLTAAARDES